ncbi:MAG: hypothetical protein ACRDVW_06320, partial [Acidimicrobiales bacterium]
MSRTTERRAAHLLRLYPASWRRRYGGEFAALMEDELAERPRCATRTLDVVRTGLTARFADLGIAGSPIDPARRVTTGLASTTCVGVLFTLAAIHPWAFTMLTWNGWDPRHAGVVQTTTTATMTVALMGLVGMLSVGLVVCVALGIGRMARHREWRLGLPLAAFGGGSSLLVVSTNRLLQDVIARGGIEWSHPGQALKQIAGTAYFSVLSVTGTTFSGHVSVTYDLWPLAPVASIVAIGVSAALLIRLLQFGARSERILEVITAALS